jgi:hypothetical protein
MTSISITLDQELPWISYGTDRNQTLLHEAVVIRRMMPSRFKLFIRHHNNPDLVTKLELSIDSMI